MRKKEKVLVEEEERTNLKERESAKIYYKCEN